MLDHFVKKEADAFRASVTSKRILLDASIGHMKSIGWETMYFNDGGAGDKLLKSQHLSEIAIRNKAFAVKGLRIIFIDRTAENKLRPYLHEVAHILLKHDFDALTLENETEANQFVDYLLRPHFNKTQIFAMIACLALAISLILHIPGIVHPSAEQTSPSPSHAKTINASENPEDIVVITSSGAKYHKSNCVYVQNKTNTQHLTRKEACALGKEPCTVCNP